MKILVVSNLYPPDVIGGYEITCAQMVAELRRRGHEVVVLTSVPRQFVEAEPGVIRSLFLGDYYHPPISKGSPIAARRAEARGHFVDPFNVSVLLTTLRDFEPDVVHVWNVIGVGAVGIVAALSQLQMPWVWHLGDSIPSAACMLGGEFITPVARFLSQQLTGTIVPVSQHVVDEIERAGVKLNDDVRIVGNWVNGPRPEPRTQWRRDGMLRVVSAGQIAPAKGVGIAVEAVAQLIRAGNQTITLDIYGSGATDWLESAIHASGAAERIRYRGARTNTELVEALSEYDVFIFPTWRREPFAVAQLEAASRGCLCIITRDSGNAEWMVDGVHCLKAERDVMSFARALQTIDLDSTVWEIASRAQQVVLRDFHIERSADIIERILADRATAVRPSPSQFDIAYRLARRSSRLMHQLIEEHTPG